MASESKLTLKSSDNELFEVSVAVAFESLFIKNMIKMLPNANVILLPDVSGKILSKVIEYLKYHVEAKNPAEEKSALTDDEIKTWDKEFVKVDLPTLFDYIEAANCLNIKSLLDLTCETVANMMRGKTPQEIRETFNIKNDYTLEEEENVRRENPWAFE